MWSHCAEFPHCGYKMQSEARAIRRVAEAYAQNIIQII